jgi:hypothetical protein
LKNNYAVPLSLEFILFSEKIKNIKKNLIKFYFFLKKAQISMEEVLEKRFIKLKSNYKFKINQKFMFA